VEYTALYYYGYRYYDAELGRWVSRDPIGESGGVHLYGFVRNEPAGHSDPFGRTGSDYYHNFANKGILHFKKKGRVAFEVELVLAPILYGCCDKVDFRQTVMTYNIEGNETDWKDAGKTVGVIENGNVTKDAVPWLDGGWWYSETTVTMPGTGQVIIPNASYKETDTGASYSDEPLAVDFPKPLVSDAGVETMRRTDNKFTGCAYCREGQAVEDAGEPILLGCVQFWIKWPQPITPNSKPSIQLSPVFGP